LIAEVRKGCTSTGTRGWISNLRALRGGLRQRRRPKRWLIWTPAHGMNWVATCDAARYGPAPRIVSWSIEPKYGSASRGVECGVSWPESAAAAPRTRQLTPPSTGIADPCGPRFSGLSVSPQSLLVPMNCLRVGANVRQPPYGGLSSSLSSPGPADSARHWASPRWPRVSRLSHWVSRPSRQAVHANAPHSQ
jgi:hypothetical protein